MAKTIGYTRTATSEQDVSNQVSALEAAGCSKVYFDAAIPGDTIDRPGLAEVIAILESGDTLKVDRIDRIARSVEAFSQFRKALSTRDIKIISLDSDEELTPAKIENSAILMAHAASQV